MPCRDTHLDDSADGGRRDRESICPADHRFRDGKMPSVYINHHVLAFKKITPLRRRKDIRPFRHIGDRQDVRIRRRGRHVRHD